MWNEYTIGTWNRLCHLRSCCSITDELSVVCMWVWCRFAYEWPWWKFFLNIVSAAPFFPVVHIFHLLISCTLSLFSLTYSYFSSCNIFLTTRFIFSNWAPFPCLSCTLGLITVGHCHICLSVIQQIYLINVFLLGKEWGRNPKNL